MKNKKYIKMLKYKRILILIKLIKQIKELKIKQKETQNIPIIENSQIDQLKPKLEENKKYIEEKIPKIEYLNIATLFPENNKIRTSSNLKNIEIEDDNNDIDDLDSYFPKHKIYYDQDSSSIDDFPEAEAERSRTSYTYRYR